MARGRMLSKSLSTSEKFASLVQSAGPLAEFCHALYPLLLPHTDDFGRLQGDPFTVKHQCYPASARTLGEFEEALRLLHEAELIIWYQVAGKKYVQITKFEPHQTGLHKRTRSQFPRVPGISGNDAEIPRQLKGTKENLTEENRREEKQRAADTVKALIDYYHERYSAAFQEKPHIDGGKDGAALKQLAATHGVEAVKRRIDAMLSSTDAFIAGSGRTIGVLRSCWNKLGMSVARPSATSRPAGCKHAPPCVDAAACTKKKIAEAKGAA